MSHNLTTWIDDELQTLDLGDDRLRRRQERLLERFAARPQASIPAACQGWAETQGAYRFFSHPRVTARAVLQPHRDATVRRIAAQPVVLLVQDTTELNFTRPRERVQGAGPLNWPERVGFFQHLQLAVTPERLPLGVVAATTWGRDLKEHGKRRDRKRKPFAAKESARWLRGYRQACAVAAEVPQTRIISVADAESDIYECFQDVPAASPRAHWIIRACQGRSLPQPSTTAPGFVKLWETAAAAAVLGQIDLRVPRSGRGPARAARLTLRATRVALKPPQRTGPKPAPVSVTAVLAREERPPEGVEPIEWLLLTSLAVESLAAACVVVEYYTCRWQIEVFFRVYKSGCRVEQIQLETQSRLQPCLALYLIVAWRVLWLTRLGRTCPELPCDAVFAAEEWRSVWTIVRREPVPAAAPPLSEMIGLVARLGGYLGRRRDGPPGPQVLWIGLQRMKDLALAWHAFGPRPAKE
jgi:hypothetical protein